jgi:hypothetical protein
MDACMLATIFQDIKWYDCDVGVLKNMHSVFSS